MRILLAAALAACGWAQTTPRELADEVEQSWVKGPASRFAAVYPFDPGRQERALGVRNQWERTAGLASIVRSGPSHAILLLSALPLSGNAGDDFYFSFQFSGVDAASASAGQWRLDRKMPFDALGQIRAQDLKVAVRPAHGVDVVDRLTVRVAGTDGFALRLNPRAQVAQVRAELMLQYSLDLEPSPKDANSGIFTEGYGHLRDQYFLRPFFNGDSPGEQAMFPVEARIPREYGLALDLPRTAQATDTEQVVQGASLRPAALLTLAYDRDWKVGRETAGKTLVELFLTPEFHPAPAAVVDEFRRVYQLLSERFGDPGGGYLAIVQLRGDPQKGWHFRSNPGVFAGGSRAAMSWKEGSPGACLGHEIGHMWTEGSGPGANFLREGWATYVESLVLAKEFDAGTVKLFWRQQAARYFRNYDGKTAILSAPYNDDLPYCKGGWILHMLEAAVGSEAFAQAMARFSQRSIAGESTWEVLAGCFRTSGFDARAFLLPWLREKLAPVVTAQAEGRRVTLRQEAPYFQLPLTVEAGSERRRVWLRGGEAAVEFAGEVGDFQIDPDGELLLRKETERGARQ